MTDEYRHIEMILDRKTARGLVVALPQGIEPDYYGKEPRVAWTSVYRFPVALKKWRDTHTNENGQPTVAGYDGPCRATGLHFDFDGASALADVRHFVEANCKGQIYIDDFKMFFSGNKGFHIHIDHPDVRALDPSPQVPDKIKGAARMMASQYASWDTCVYNVGRIFRVPNSRHDTSGLFKIPLLAMEIYKYDIDQIRGIARFQRSVADAARQWLKSMEVF